jgi:acetylornithine/N-succinyldiaminopimelate aminotransferase
VLAKEAAARHLTPGTHGTTHGGSPLACAAGNAVLDVISAPGFPENVGRSAKRLRAGLEIVVQENPNVFTEVRGNGLLLGLQCIPPQAEIQKACVARGLLTLPASENVLRLTPPLIVTEKECELAIQAINSACAPWSR